MLKRTNIVETGRTIKINESKYNACFKSNNSRKSSKFSREDNKINNVEILNIRRFSLNTLYMLKRYFLLICKMIPNKTTVSIPESGCIKFEKIKEEITKLM